MYPSLRPWRGLVSVCVCVCVCVCMCVNVHMYVPKSKTMARSCACACACVCVCVYWCECTYIVHALSMQKIWYIYVHISLRPWQGLKSVYRLF